MQHSTSTTFSPQECQEKLVAFCSLFNFQGYWSIHFRFQSTDLLMINIDSSSLVNTSSCLFFFLKALRDALSVTLYRFIVGSFKFFNFWWKSWKFIPFTHDHNIFICFLVWESYHQYHVLKLIISVILITCLLENFFKLYIKGVKGLTVY